MYLMSPEIVFLSSLFSSLLVIEREASGNSEMVYCLFKSLVICIEK